MRVREAALGALFVAGLGAAAWLLLNRYTPGNPDSAFLAVTQEYLQAALGSDSARLVELNAAPLAINRGLDAARERPEFLRGLLQDLRLRHSSHNGIHTALFFDAKAVGKCAGWPLTVFVEGTPSAARIQDVRWGCAGP